MPRPASRSLHVSFARLGLVASLAGGACSPAERATGAPRATSSPAADRGPASARFAGVPLPAGLCGYDLRLNETCEGVPHASFALVLGHGGDEASAEASLAAGRTLGLAPGYPFAVTFDALPARDRRRGLAIVAGLFVARADAESYRARLGSLPSEVVELDWRESYLGNWEHVMGIEQEAVELRETTPAWSAGQIDRGKLPMRPRCTLARGRVFLESRASFHGFEYAPVRCDDGSEAFVPWTATRMLSVVVPARAGALIHQVITVECDEPYVETRRFGTDGRVSEVVAHSAVTEDDPC